MKALTSKFGTGIGRRKAAVLHEAGIAAPINKDNITIYATFAEN
jgi:hypothetical protein